MIREGYQQTAIGLIPCDWEVKELGDVSNTSSGTTPPRKFAERYYQNGSVNWVKTTDLNNGEIHKTEEQITDVALKETSLKVYPLETVLIAMYGGFNQIGRTGLLKISASVNQALIAIQPNHLYLASIFLINYLNYRVDYWKSIAVSSRKDPNITSSDVRKFPIALPPLPEQKAIAEVLGDVDRLINACDKLIAKKRDIKQGAMQELLTGRSRLPGFSGEWEVKKLGEVTDIDIDNLKSNTDRNYCFQYISLEDVEKGTLKSTSECVFYSAPSRARRKVLKNDILVATVRPNLQSHLFIKNDVNDLVCSTGFAVIRCDDNTTNAEFIYHHFFANIINSQFNTLLVGSNYPAVNSSDIKNLQIPLPTLEEQKAIAQILSDMDSEIEALEKKRDKYKLIKQGMMQELLTGKTRILRMKG